MSKLPQISTKSWEKLYRFLSGQYHCGKIATGEWWENSVYSHSHASTAKWEDWKKVKNQDLRAMNLFLNICKSQFFSNSVLDEKEQQVVSCNSRICSSNGKWFVILLVNVINNNKIMFRHKKENRRSFSLKKNEFSDDCYVMCLLSSLDQRQLLRKRKMILIYSIYICKKWNSLWLCVCSMSFILINKSHFLFNLCFLCINCIEISFQTVSIQKFLWNELSLHSYYPMWIPMSSE